MRKNRGFTLIELLVVIGIISVLSAVVVPNFMGARERARDAQRKNDVRQIQKAFELFKDNQTPIKKYPTNAQYTSITCDQSWVSLAGDTYLNKFPCDPSSGSQYTYNQTSDLTYTLTACLENKSDPDGDTTSSCNWGGSATGIPYQIIEP
ncbi:type II secretion system protein [Candidatus Gottesmanbacteria bacterium]|nr:type II secretion system protein [Candidatus Gottesmanbacteria bacterium]